MTRQIRFSSADLQYTDPSEDCYLDPQDPIFQELGIHASGQVVQSAQQHFRQRDHAAKQGIVPGTPAWFAMTQ
jgi:hypothetical protein